MTDFQCLVCGECCKWPGFVYISEDDVARMSRHLSLKEFDFVNRYAEIVHRPRLNLKTKENGECIFLDDKVCAIHAAKPIQCATFPDQWKINDLEKYCNGQKAIKRKDSARP
ncbi:MAG: YkgJ family cysteine cluster protein [Candidatus Omnitrophica bacterium]|nr:YkgJ family cysteine cluster protein [Candidatus Omnitrophota bacterium]